MIRDVKRILVDIERECLAADAGITACSWETCEASWVVQRRLSHELEIALRDVPRDGTAFAPTRKRIYRIMQYRDLQIKRLQALKGALSERLTTIERFRAFSKQIEARPAALLDVYDLGVYANINDVGRHVMLGDSRH